MPEGLKLNVIHPRIHRSVKRLNVAGSLKSYFMKAT